MKEILQRFKEELGFSIHCYCFMDNHLHLLIQTNDVDLSLIMKKIAVTYAQYYNNKYHHVGHVFQNRFFSDGIMSERQYINVIRYILKNPEQAGLSSMERYKWSSYQEFFPKKSGGENTSETEQLTDIQLVIDFFGGQEVMFNTMHFYEEETVTDISERVILKDEQVAE